MDRLRFERLLTRRADRRRVLLSADAGLVAVRLSCLPTRVGARLAIPYANSIASFVVEADHPGVQPA